MKNEKKVFLLVDFDNIYLGLKSQSREVAEKFASNPLVWLRWFEDNIIDEQFETRRMLVKRCYINPKSFGQFRPYFVNSGFQVIDCPTLTESGKNSADIHMVIDIMESIDHSANYDEYIILSSDSDFTPVLVKLREYNKRTFIVNAGYSVPAYRNCADHAMGSSGLIDIIESSIAKTQRTPAPKVYSQNDKDITKLVKDFVIRNIQENSNRVVLSSLAFSVTDAFPSIKNDGKWGSFNKFSEYLYSLGIKEFSIDNTIPGYASIGENEIKADTGQNSGIMNKLSSVIDIPNLGRTQYKVLYGLIQDYINKNTYSLTECSKEIRDQMSNEGIGFSRKNSNFVLIGITKRLPLNDKESVNINELSKSFYENIQRLINQAQITLSEEEVQELEEILLI